jgi:hypothetical protein
MDQSTEEVTATQLMKGRSRGQRLGLPGKRDGDVARAIEASWAAGCRSARREATDDETTDRA